MELKELAGEHLLDAVDFSNERVKTWGDQYKGSWGRTLQRFDLPGGGGYQQRRALPKPPSFAAVFRPWHDAHSACQRLRSQNTVSSPPCGLTWSTTLAGRIRS